MSEKPVAKLIGEDGNVFNIIGKVHKVLTRTGQADKAKEFVDKAHACDSYDAVLRLVHNYVEVE